MPGNIKPVDIVRWLFAFAMIATGAVHFISPEGFLPMVAWLPFPLFAVYASGVAEIALGALLLPRRTRRLAGIGLIALYIAVFPANIYLAVADDVIFFGDPMPKWVAIARMPFQLVFIALAWWTSRDAKPNH